MSNIDRKINRILLMLTNPSNCLSSNFNARTDLKNTGGRIIEDLKDILEYNLNKEQNKKINFIFDLLDNKALSFDYKRQINNFVVNNYLNNNLDLRLIDVLRFAVKITGQESLELDILKECENAYNDYLLNH